jgi:type IV secretory pathway VirB4 component
MANTGTPSTQEHLPIAGIQDGVVLMTDGSIRVILKVEPINFDLKSENEQNAIIYGYQGFLNSLDFPIQFVVQSKQLDLERYLIRLQESQKVITNDLLRIQIEDYVGFVRRLISVANIMSKRFYTVISYSAVTKQSNISQFTSIFHKQPTGPIMDQDQFTRFRAEANNRASIIANGLGRLGVKSSLLNTQELIELYYGIYNPDVATEERLTGDVSELSSGVISSTAMPELGSPEAAAQAPALQPEAPLPQPPAVLPAQAYAVPSGIADDIVAPLDSSPVNEVLPDEPVTPVPAPLPATYSAEKSAEQQPPASQI